MRIASIVPIPVLALAAALAACTSTPGAAPPAAAAAPPPAAAAKRAGAPPVSSLSLEEKVGQLFQVSAHAGYLADDSPTLLELTRLVTEQRIGGICWLRSQVTDASLLAARLQALAPVPLLFSADLESGTGMRFPEAVWGPYGMALAASGDPGLAERRAYAVAVEARALGIGQVYAPVADVNVNPANPVINVRSFGEDPADVSRFVAATVKGLQAGGALATLKHFPGHGDTAVDSHRALPVLEVTRERLETVELVPFRAGLAAGAASVMVAHVAVPAIDPTPAPVLANAPRNDVFSDVPEAEVVRGGTLPATLSPALTEGLLRKELGFDGLVVTDAMNMGGIAAHFAPGEAAVRAILAGADLVIFSPDTPGAIAAVLAAVREGRIPVERIDRSVARLLAAKERLGLFSERVPPLAAVGRVVASREHLALEEEVARRGLTLYREAPGVLPLDAARKVAHVAVLDESPTSSTAGRIETELRRRAPALVTARLGPGSCAADVDAAVEAARKADVVVLSLFVRARSGAGKIAIPAPGKEAAERLLALGRPVVALSFGSPYLLSELPSLPTFLCGYGAQEVVQTAAARALYGEAAIEGKLPVTVPGIAPRGTGIRKEAVR